MLNMFEKLINEHGSSAILKERIELINDKYEAMQGKFDNSEKENELLRKEVGVLKQQISTLQSQVASAQPQSNELPKEQQDILKLLFIANDYVRDELIARELNLEMGMLTYHLDELLEKKLLDMPSYISGSEFTGSTGYSEQGISTKGRKYFVEHIST